jgi:hypothetical protein
MGFSTENRKGVAPTGWVTRRNTKSTSGSDASKQQEKQHQREKKGRDKMYNAGGIAIFAGTTGPKRPLTRDNFVLTTRTKDKRSEKNLAKVDRLGGCRDKSEVVRSVWD